jgi:hypothetical protein
MSSDKGARHRDDPDNARPIILRAADAFDGRDYVMSPRPMSCTSWP